MDDLLDLGWPSLRARIAAVIDIEASAKETGAFVRRREFRSPEHLLHAVLALVGGELSQQHAADWLRARGFADVSKVAVHKRLLACAPWLRRILEGLLARQAMGDGPPAPDQLRLILVDATALSRPGSEGTDWRLHSAYSLSEGRFRQVSLSDAHGGERLERFRFFPGDVVVGDGAYARAGQLRWVRQHGAEFLVRSGVASCRWQDAHGRKLDLEPVLHDFLASGEAAREVAVTIKGGKKTDQPLACRLILGRLTAEQAEAGRKKVEQRARKKGYEPSALSLDAASCLLLLTSLEGQAFPPERLLALYRLRWQIEIAFKRLKSLAQIDAIPAQRKEVGETLILARMILVALNQELTRELLALSPSGRARAGSAPYLPLEAGRTPAHPPAPVPHRPAQPASHA